MNRIWKVERHHLLLTEISGVVSLETVALCRRTIETLPSFDPHETHVIDLTGVENVTLSGEELRLTPTETVHDHDARRVLIAPSALTFGLSRMLLGWTDTVRPASQVVKDRAAALEWLGLPADALDDLGEPDAQFPSSNEQA